MNLADRIRRTRSMQAKIRLVEVSERPSIPVRAGAVRAAHALVAVIELWALGWVWYCGLARRRGRALAIAVGLLVAEGIALVIGRGNCPLGPLQSRLGDPVPLFELVLPPRAAKAAVPVLFTIAVAGLTLVAIRRVKGQHDLNAGGHEN